MVKPTTGIIKKILAVLTDIMPGCRMVMIAIYFNHPTYNYLFTFYLFHVRYFCVTKIAKLFNRAWIDMIKATPRFIWRRLYLWYNPLFYRFELVFTYAAYRTNPVVGKVFKFCSGSDASVRISDRRVIDPVTDCAYIFFHILLVYP